MTFKNKLNALVTSLFILTFLLACGGGNQMEEANKAVDVANKKLNETQELFTRTEARNKELFNVNVKTVQQLQYYKAIMSKEAKAIADDYEKIAENLKDISKQYDDISRMNVNDKYKDYVKLKSDEFAKRAEAINIRKANPLAFLEIDDPRTMVARLEENTQKADRLYKDAEDMGEKAKKMEEENKDLFKS